MEELHVYNTLSKEKEKFEALNPPFVGMYVCGPTVYGDAHLGHSRPAVTFDLMFRYLKYLGYKVRYVRNITDVGHLVGDADHGEDKMLKQARLEQLEPMEIAQNYTNNYHRDIGALNCLPPSIEPQASGHIPEQIEMVERIVENGLAYECKGSVYFDVKKYNETFQYGKLSRRNLDEMLGGTREDLEGQEDKRYFADFALWKAAPPEHLMQWNSPWGKGYPGWHLECTVMSTKYLGTKYDIHGGGMDLIFPHHEAELAQSNAAINDPHSHELDEATYWLHNNMITISNQKMGKSLGNFVELWRFYSGDSERLDRDYSPMIIRMFLLQAHYRSVLDFSLDNLKASEKAYQRLSDVWYRVNAIDPDAYPAPQENEDFEKNLGSFKQEALGFMNDDFNTARVIARMFEAVPVINEIHGHKKKAFPVKKETFLAFRDAYNALFLDVLGLLPEEKSGVGDAITEELMQLIIELRKQARTEKNWAVADKIRDGLGQLKIKLKDTPEGTEWYVEE